MAIEMFSAAVSTRKDSLLSSDQLAEIHSWSGYVIEGPTSMPGNN
jgi:hypothetical protein